MTDIDVTTTYALRAGAADSLKESAVAAKEAIGDLAVETAAYTKNKITDMKTELSRGIQRNPWKAVFIAGAVGLLAGMLLKRNR